MLGRGIESISATTVTFGDSGGALYEIELEDEDLFTVKAYWTPKAPTSAPRRGERRRPRDQASYTCGVRLRD